VPVRVNSGVVSRVSDSEAVGSSSSLVGVCVRSVLVSPSVCSE